MSGIARLLIVDDEKAQMRALCDTLTLEGYMTCGFHSAREALVALKAGAYDLLLTDLMMPEMDGIALIGAVREIDSALGAIVMTGTAAEFRTFIAAEIAKWAKVVKFANIKAD